MKKIKLSILFTFISALCSAQFYTFDHYTEKYTEFDDGEELYDIFIDNNALVSLNMEIRLYDHLLNSSTLVVGKNGFLVNTSDSFSFALDPFVAKLEQRETGSSVSIKIDSVSKSEPILQVQWKNMGLIDHDSSDFANFQLWVYLETQQIEFRYGPSKVTGTQAFGNYNGPQILLALLTPDFLNSHEDIVIIEKDGNPAILPVGLDGYTGAPPDGMVMRFSNKLLTTESLSADVYLIYPNPIDTYLVIDKVPGPGKSSACIFDNSGKLLMEISDIEAGKKIDVSSLQQGTYGVRIISDSGSIYRVLVKRVQD